MELTSKQRAQLRGLANDIKGRVLENSMLTAREAAEQLAVAARCEVVQVIGSKFVLYRMQHDKSRRKIELVKAKRPQA